MFSVSWHKMLIKGGMGGLPPCLGDKYEEGLGLEFGFAGYPGFGTL